MGRNLRLFALAGLVGLGGCQTSPPTPKTGFKLDATARFIEHPQFRAAFKVAPDLIPAMLEQITRYEAEIERTSNR